MLIFFTIFCLVTACSGRITKYKVPYGYLLTLNNVGGPYSLTGTNFDENLVSWFHKTCKKGNCFLAVYKNLTNSEEMFQVLDKKKNKCLTLSTSNCLLFNNNQYEYTFIYEKEKDNAQKCYRTVVDSDFSIPTNCPEGWSVFQRANGKFWCYRIFQENVNFTSAREKCQEEQAELYGFESKEEYAEFEAAVLKFVGSRVGEASVSENTKRHVWIGATRKRKNKCEKPSLLLLLSNNSCKEYPFFWINKTVSRIPQVPIKLAKFDGSGDCLAYAKYYEDFDDYGCDLTTPFYACGKYASSKDETIGPTELE